MPIQACAEKLHAATTAREEGLALDELLRLPKEQLQQHFDRTTIAVTAFLLRMAADIARPNGRRISSDLFEALGPARVVERLFDESIISTWVLGAAACSSPDVRSAVLTAALNPWTGRLMWLDHLRELDGDAGQRNVNALMENPGDGRQQPAVDRLQLLAELIGVGPIHHCHALLKSAPQVAEQHIRSLMQWIERTDPDLRHHVLRQAPLDLVTGILHDAARVQCAPNMRSLGSEVFDALPTMTLRNCVDRFPERTLQAAAMVQDVPSLGRVFHAAAENGHEGICTLLSQQFLKENPAAAQCFFSRCTGHEIAGLFDMATLADQATAAGILEKAMEHATNPIGRLYNGLDPNQDSLTRLIERSGRNLHDVLWEAAKRRMPPEATPNIHYREVDWSYRPPQPQQQGAPREPGRAPAL